MTTKNKSIKAKHTELCQMFHSTGGVAMVRGERSQELFLSFEFSADEKQNLNKLRDQLEKAKFSTICDYDDLLDSYLLTATKPLITFKSY